MENSENKKLSDKVADALKKAVAQLEELQVQMNLGKAEASDKYEEWKKEFSHFVNDAKTKVNSDNMKKVQEEIEALLDELRVQLALGKAEGFEAFQAQKKKILEKIHEIENKIKNDPTLNKIYAVFIIQLEKFKVFLEWLEQKYKEGKEAASDTFDAGKEKLNSFVASMKEKLENYDTERWSHFQEEVASAFSRFKDAFSSSSTA